MLCYMCSEPELKLITAVLSSSVMSAKPSIMIPSLLDCICSHKVLKRDILSL